MLIKSNKRLLSDAPTLRSSTPQSRALNAWLRRFSVWCLGAFWQLVSGGTQPPVSHRLWLVTRCSGCGAIRRRFRALSAHSVFWFLAPWVLLVQRIGSRHSALGAAVNCRVTGI